MKSILLCSIVGILMPCVITAATTGGSAAVGLYAPDRYEGIPDICLKPMDFGYCRAKVKRYYFDMRRMKCAMFYFGGCAGNLNNFKSLDDCNKVCLDGFVDESSVEQEQQRDTVAANSYQQNSRTTTRDFNRNNNNNNNNNDNIQKGGINYKNTKYNNNNNYHNTQNTTIQTSAEDDYEN